VSRLWRRLGAFWRGVLLGWLAAGLAGATLAAMILFGGLYDTAADNPHLRPVAWAVHRTMISSVQRRAADAPPLPPVTPARLLSGAREYEAHCLACHGGPGVARAPWASALLPTPSFLIDARTRWTPGELRALIAHGVKMSAMPAWGEVLPGAKIDDLVMFLELMPRLTAAQYQRLREQVRALPTDPLTASGPTATLAPNPMRDTQPLGRAVTPEPDPPAREGR
jgi:mono/diheme cytochrome c family protein